MAHTRVHELAKELGIESREVLEQLKAMGEFVTSASSVVPLRAEMALRQARAQQRVGGQTPKSAAVPPQPEAPRKRSNSWDQAGIPEEGRAVWFRYGLGENDAGLAMLLLEKGLLPEDLHLNIRGRRAVHRLRGGEARAVVAQEMREARSQVPAKPRDLPSTAVHRFPAPGSPKASKTGNRGTTT